MEKTELTVTIEPERLDALRYFLSAKEKSTPQRELQRALEELYEKYVPAEMREYLDSKCREMREYLDSKCRPSPARPRPRRPQKDRSPELAQSPDSIAEKGGSSEICPPDQSDTPVM